MDWSDDALVLGASKHGEGHLVLDVLTASRGRWRGYVKGGSSSRQRGVHEPGNKLRVTWTSRIEDQLGTFTSELTHARAALIMLDRDGLAVLTSLTATLSSTLHEREAHGDLFEAADGLVDLLTHGPDLVMAAAALVKVELTLLGELGFGLDFSECAATGGNDDLAYVSPKSAKAVSRAAAGPWADKLLKLPPFLLEDVAPDLQQVRDGLALTGFFLERSLLLPHRKQLPEVRARLMSRI